MAAPGPSSPDTTKETCSAAAAAAAKGAATADAASRSAATAEATEATAAAAPTAAAAATTTAATTPTYFVTKESKAYSLSKKLLAAGSLDDALSTLEMTLGLSREMIANCLKSQNAPKNDGNDRGGNDDGVELHEGLAPLYYLYGTTLLYSVEESDVMMANNQGEGGAADMEVEPQENDDGEQPQPMADDEAESGEAEAAPAADPAEDLQIAWENLDLARTIVSRLVAGFHDKDSDGGKIVLKSDEKQSLPIVYAPSEQKELLLDLAQIHTRLGDLQRANANILPCIDDYNLALKLRRECLGEYDRKVADAHFSLAGVYAEAPNKVNENEGRVDKFVSSLGSGGGGDAMEEDKRGLSEEEKVEYRERSLDHYLACGTAFAGLMAEMCGEDAEEFTKTNDGAAAAASAASASASANRCKTMAALRDRISALRPLASNAEEFDDLKEMMDEIQEAMDSAEETEEGLKSLGEMKANEIKKHDMKVKGEGAAEETGGGATTTIGFGAASANAFGGGAASAATAAPTVMVVKKKKRAQADDPAKRIKSN